MAHHYHNGKDRVLGLTAFDFVLFSKSGKRLYPLTFYAEDQRSADRMALAWARSGNQTIKRRRVHAARDTR